MSGGVDSSVTAALLKAEGYDVVGVTLQLYDHGAATHRKGACCAGQDIHDARAVAERIGIPHYVLDYESRFKEAVIDRFAESYVAGETPVPCVDCNQSIKFRDLLVDRARARRQGAGDRPLRRLARAAGRRPRALSRARGRARPELFPVRHHARAARPAALSARRAAPRRETRELARRFGLAVADKHDSQDICFVPTGRYTDVIERLQAGRRRGRRHRRSRRQACSAAMTASSISPSASGAGLAIAAGAAALCGAARCRDAPRRGRPARGAAHAAHRSCATSTGSARARSTQALERRPARGVRQGALDPPAAAGLADAAATAASRSSWSTARTACRPARPACSTMRPTGQARVLGGGFIAQRGRGRRRDAAREVRVAGAASRHDADGRGDGGRNRQAARSPRPMRAGRRSTISCSARCSSAGRKASIAAAERIGGRILEVGVGTGISLPDYSRSNRIVGVDYSEPMLRKAQERVTEHKLDQCRGAGGDGRASISAFPTRRSTWWWRNTSSPRCPTRRRRSTSSRACSSPAARSSWSTTSAPRAGCAARSSSGFAPVARRLGWRPEFPWARLDALGRAPRRRAPDRAPADAAARAFLADPVRARGDGRERSGRCGGGRSPIPLIRRQRVLHRR